jgi:hypothetical protein
MVRTHKRPGKPGKNKAAASRCTPYRKTMPKQKKRALCGQSAL